MSAYVEPRAHINALVRLALEGPIGVPISPGRSWSSPYFGGEKVGPENADRLGLALIRENIASVADHYEDTDPDKLPGMPVDPKDPERSLQDYAYFGGRQLTVPEALLALAGYEYQSCEHDGWLTSDAYHFIHDLTRLVASRVPGVEGAGTWEIDSDARAVA